MSGFNLPPGCSLRDIPGNRPEDAEWDSLFEWLSDSGLDPSEIRRRIESPVWRRKRG